MSRMGEIIRGSGTGVSRESGRSSPLRRATPQLSMRLGHYTLGFAGTEEELREAQRLRFKVFADEFGAEICSGVPGHDIDYYDDFCDHLIVRDLDAGRVVGTYRILPPVAAQAVGEYYSEKEFNIERLEALRPQLVEVGRSCIHRDYRSGAVIALLWQGLAAYMAEGNYRYLMGCASIGMADGGHNAANVYRSLDAQFRAPQEYSTFPLNRLPIERLGNDQDAVIPPLIKGYVRAGAWICGEPAWDPQFNCADVLVLMPMSQIGPRYARRFLHSGE
jgi:putative hemolysin